MGVVLCDTDARLVLVAGTLFALSRITAAPGTISCDNEFTNLLASGQNNESVRAYSREHLLGA